MSSSTLNWAQLAQQTGTVDVRWQGVRGLTQQAVRLTPEQVAQQPQRQGIAVTPENKRRILREYLDHIGQRKPLSAEKDADGTTADEVDALEVDLLGSDAAEEPMTTEMEEAAFDELVRSGAIVVPGYTLPGRQQSVSSKSKEGRKGTQKPDAARIGKKQARHARRMQKARKGR